jgi:hypothetical protein
MIEAQRGVELLERRGQGLRVFDRGARWFGRPTDAYSLLPKSET